MSKKNRKAQQNEPQPNDESKKDTSPYAFSREKIKIDLKIRELPWSDKQKEFIGLALDKNVKVLIVKGPAGSSKTILAVYSALKLLNDKKFSEALYIRVPVESSGFTLGWLAGGTDEKLSPYAHPWDDKLSELLPISQIKALKDDNRLKVIPTGFLRGSSINGVAISDETQNFTKHDILLTMTRMGKFSKLIMLGDTRQSDIKNSGFSDIYDLFDTDEAKEKGIYTFKFGVEDIKRSEFLSYVLEKFEEMETKQDWNPKPK